MQSALPDMPVDAPLTQMHNQHPNMITMGRSAATTHMLTESVTCIN